MQPAEAKPGMSSDLPRMFANKVRHPVQGLPAMDFGGHGAPQYQQPQQPQAQQAGAQAHAGIPNG